MVLPPKWHLDRKDGGSGLVAVAIDKDKNSKNALKWAIDNILQRGQTVLLLHVKLKPDMYKPYLNLNIHTAFEGMYSYKFQESIQSPDIGYQNTLKVLEPDSQSKQLFVPFRFLCSRNEIKSKDIVLEDIDVTKALTEYVTQMEIETLVIGAASKSKIIRGFKTTDVPGSVLKGAPDFCTVYVISKGKIMSARSASRPAPFSSSSSSSSSPLCQQIQSSGARLTRSDKLIAQTPCIKERHQLESPSRSSDESDFFTSPFTRRGLNGKSYGEISMPDTDISFVSSGRESIDLISPSYYDSDLEKNSILSTSPDTYNYSYESTPWRKKSIDLNSPTDMSFSDGGTLSTSSQSADDLESEMRRLKLELKKTMDMYSTACKEALTAKQKATELQQWKMEEERRLEEARLAGEAAMAHAEEEKAKFLAAIEHAEAARRISELVQKRYNAELSVLKELKDRKREVNSSPHTDIRYRRYTIEEIEAATEFFAINQKIGEGGYGPVYKCYLDHTPAAVKILRPDAAQGRSQFNQEVEVLSRIRHPNMVLLMGACPEYGCLVYEFMANGSLEDRLFRRGNTPTLSWQLRFRIAAEIGTGLLFLHNAKPEPLVHRDLKPANILLDRNYVSKISDVGLARLVPSSIADTVTQYRMTSTAGTFCYIDPEYQRTGKLGTKSDIYSLGILFLQVITGRPPMGLTYYVEKAIEKGTFTEMLDSSVPDWPVADAFGFAKLALMCAKLRRKDRPDLGNVIMPELNRLRMLAEDSMQYGYFSGSPVCSSNSSQVSMHLVNFC